MNDEWETPQDLFDKLNDEFDFTLDAACNDDFSNAKVDPNIYCAFNKSFDSLKHSWKTGDDAPSVWLNPPYSRELINKFMKKAYSEAFEHGIAVVALVRFDPSAKWFQDWVHGKASEVRMLARRVRFVGAPSAYPFPSCVVIYNFGTSNTSYTLWDWK